MVPRQGLKLPFCRFSPDFLQVFFLGGQNYTDLSAKNFAGCAANSLPSQGSRFFLPLLCKTFCKIYAKTVYKYSLFRRNETFFLHDRAPGNSKQAAQPAPPAVCRKSLAEFAPAGAKKLKSVFPGDTGLSCAASAKNVPPAHFLHAAALGKAPLSQSPDPCSRGSPHARGRPCPRSAI